MAQSAIVDASTIQSILGGRFENFLIAQPSYYSGAHGIAGLRRRANEAFSSNEHRSEAHEYLRHVYSRILTLLEAYLLYDELVVDADSLSTIFDSGASIYSGQEWLYEGHLSRLVGTAPLTDTYRQEIAANVSGYIDWLNRNDIESVFNFRRPSKVDIEPEDFTLLKDGAMSDVSAKLFGDSSNQPLRALFYHELSQCSGLPLVLHPAKQKVLAELNREILGNIADAYARLTGAVGDELAEYELDLNMPPLAFTLLTESLESDVPLLDVAVNMKQDPEIKSLRNLLSDLHRAAQHGRLHYQKQIKAVARKIAARLEERSEYSMPFLTSKTLYLSEIPAISTVLKLFGMGNVTIPDLTLYEKPYVTLFDKWVNFAP